MLDQDFSSPHYIYLLLLYFLVSDFLCTAQNFSSRISYTRERCNLGSWLTWVLLPPNAAFPSQWMKHGALLRKGTSKNIKVFILFRFTEFDKMLPFYKNISVFVYRSRQSDESIEMWVRVKMWSCCALNLCSSLRRTQHGLILWILMVMFFFFIKSCKVQLNILFVGLFFSGKSV